MKSETALIKTTAFTTHRWLFRFSSQHLSISHLNPLMGQPALHYFQITTIEAWERRYHFIHLWMMG